jgi:hypothetical protein
MVADLIDQNLRRDPSRRRLLRPGRAVLDVPDAGVAVTVIIGRGRVQVRDGGASDTALWIIADARSLMRLASAPLRFGLPDLLAPDGRRILADVVTGRVRIHGWLRTVPTLRRLTMLLSAR